MNLPGFEIKPIGIVKSDAREAIDENWGQVVSEIHLQNDLKNGLAGLDNFSHAIIIFFMHQATFNSATDLKRHPRGILNISESGIFAQRAKHRPNPIGITTVKILEIKDNVLTVQGLDAIDGTPVIDIKPYFPVFDNVNNPIFPGWVNNFMKDYF